MGEMGPLPSLWLTLQRGIHEPSDDAAVLLPSFCADFSDSDNFVNPI